MLRTDADNEATAHETLPFFVALYIPLNITDAKNPISVRAEQRRKNRIDRQKRRAEETSGKALNKA